MAERPRKRPKWGADVERAWEIPGLAHIVLRLAEMGRTEEALVVWYVMGKAPKPGRTPALVPVDLATLPDSTCLGFFRFVPAEVDRILACLGFASFVPTTSLDMKLPFRDCFLVLCSRLSYPNRWCQLEHVFGRREQVLRSMMHVAIDCLLFGGALASDTSRVRRRDVGVSGVSGVSGGGGG